MIKFKVPIKKNEDGYIDFYEWECIAVPYKSLSQYLSEDLKLALAKGIQQYLHPEWIIPNDFKEKAENIQDVPINRIILNGKSIPEFPNRDGSVCPDQSIFTPYIPMDGDEVIIVPALGFGIGEAIMAGVISVAGVSAATVATVINVGIAMAVSFLISTLLSYLTAPSKAKGDAIKSSPTSYGWNGIQNSYGGGQLMSFYCATIVDKTAIVCCDRQFINLRPNGTSYTLEKTFTRNKISTILENKLYFAECGVEAAGNAVLKEAKRIVEDNGFLTARQLMLDMMPAVEHMAERYPAMGGQISEMEFARSDYLICGMEPNGPFIILLSSLNYFQPTYYNNSGVVLLSQLPDGTATHVEREIRKLFAQSQINRMELIRGFLPKMVQVYSNSYNYISATGNLLLLNETGAELYSF
jgi:hypothetical protein